jgi:hypothetical protein
MTYAVISQQDNRDLVVGTLWANADHDAQSVADSFAGPEKKASVTIRRIEPRELPLKIHDY